MDEVDTLDGWIVIGTVRMSKPLMGVPAVSARPSYAVAPQVILVLKSDRWICKAYVTLVKFKAAVCTCCPAKVGSTGYLLIAGRNEILAYLAHPAAESGHGCFRF